MDRSTLDGYMAVVAASGSIVFLALHVHKRLLSDFMKRLELEIGPPGKNTGKKNVTFAAKLETHICSESEKSGRKGAVRDTDTAQNSNCIFNAIIETMPPNRLALYKGILEFRSLKGHKGSTCL